MKRNQTKLGARDCCRSEVRGLEQEEGNRKQWWIRESGVMLLVAIRSSSQFRRQLSPPTPFFQMILECEMDEFVSLLDEAEQDETDC